MMMQILVVVDLVVIMQVAVEELKVRILETEAARSLKGGK